MRLDRVASDALSALHREAIRDPRELRDLLERTSRGRVVLSGGIDSRNRQRTAVIDHVAQDALILSSPIVKALCDSHLYFTFEVDGARYFFSSAPGSIVNGRVTVPFPGVVYRAERRDLRRDRGLRIRRMAGLQIGGERLVPAIVVDETNQGVAVCVPSVIAQDLPEAFKIAFEGDDIAPMFAGVRHRTAEQRRAGWTRVGLSVSSVPVSGRVQVERLGTKFARGWSRFPRSSASIHQDYDVGAFAGEPASSSRVRVVDFKNNLGQHMRGIINEFGNPEGATAVVIPPAWGRTKETLLPLALTLVDSFRASGNPITVLRFDGTNRRGESYIDPGCRESGQEYLHFTFSQAASDIVAAAEFLDRRPSGAPSKTFLITFSLASIEGRHALATASNRFNGWISVVGMADLQSGLRAISGGIDYGYGLMRGVRFGRHELAGVIADMDRTGLDAIGQSIGFLEDARREMAQIEVPVTWLHGRDDAWMEMERVGDILSYGRTDNRRLIEVPTGHQLRSSRSAFAVFGIIAEELGAITGLERVEAKVPDPMLLRASEMAEFKRREKVNHDLRGFWKDYLLGRDRTIGMELLSATAGYRSFMELQVQRLKLKTGSSVADMGCGTGGFSVGLCNRSELSGLRVLEVDFVLEALERCRKNRMTLPDGPARAVHQCVSDLGVNRRVGIPFQSCSLDAVLASLLISYLPSPGAFLKECLRVLKPNGRLVVSSLVKDADISTLLRDGLIEFATPEARYALTESTDEVFEGLVRSFLNDGARILDLEEHGEFQFWDGRELAYLVANAGFEQVEVEHGLGSPPQAVVVSAFRP